jgi:hypothetical protein
MIDVGPQVHVICRLKNYAEFWMLLACCNEEIADIRRHNFIGPHPSDTVPVDGQRMSKEAIPFDSRAKVRPNDNLHALRATCKTQLTT